MLLKHMCLLLFAVLSATPAFAGQWVSIFNGHDLTGWSPKIKGLPLGQDPYQTFVVRDGVIAVNYSQYDAFNNRFGHLFFEKRLSRYRLRLEYRFIGVQLPDAPGWAYKNSGVMLHGQSAQSMGIEQDFPVSIEGQFLGADEQGKHRPTGNLCTPGTIASVSTGPILEHCTNSSSASFTGQQWVTAEFVVDGHNRIEHWINGEKVYHYQNLRLDPDEKDAQLLLSEGASVELSSGYISLQSESHPIEFRNIQLMILD